MPQIYKNEIINNREAAILLWLGVAFIISLTNKNIRESFLGLFKTFFNRTIIVPFIFLLLNVWTILLVLYLNHLWDLSNIGEVIFWFFGVVFVLFINSNKSREEGYFRKIILDNIKLVIILEFVINLYVFEFWIELIFLPVVVLIGLLLGVSSRNSKYKNVENVLNFILGIIGIVTIIFVLVSIFSDFQGFLSIKNVTDFILIPILTIGLLPFFYFLALYLIYDLIFNQYKFRVNDSKLGKYAKIRTLLEFHINFKLLKKWFKKLPSSKFENKEEIDKAIDEIKPLKPFFYDGFIYSIFNAIMSLIKYLNLVELFKYLSQKLLPANYTIAKKIQYSRTAVDIFIIMKWGIVIFLWNHKLESGWITYFVWYLLVTNLFTYFYYHTWSSNILRDEFFDIARIKRRLFSSLLAILFSIFGFAYLYAVPYSSEFKWENGTPSVTLSIWFSISNSFTANYNQVNPITDIGNSIAIIQLLMMFVFITIIIGSSLPHLNQTNKE